MTSLVGWTATSRRTRLDADLVVLLACRSGVSAGEGDRGVGGLGGAFLQAGARSVLATL